MYSKLYKLACTVQYNCQVAIYGHEDNNKLKSNCTCDKAYV